MENISSSTNITDDDILKYALSPQNDVVFKALFGKKGNENILEAMLSAFLKQKIKCKEVIREARVGELRPDEKYGSLDVLAELEDGRTVDIEMQVGRQDSIYNRMAFYASSMTCSTKPSVRYKDIPQKIVIFLVAKPLYEKLNTGIHEMITVLKENRNIETIDLHKYYIIELPKVKESDLESFKWTAFLLGNKEALSEMKEHDSVLKKATEELDYLTGDEEVKRLAVLRDRYYREIGDAEGIGYDHGFKDGVTQGITEGMTRGISQGIAQGKSQLIENMIRIGKTIEEISELTGLSIKEIEEVKNNISKD